MKANFCLQTLGSIVDCNKTAMASSDSLQDSVSKNAFVQPYFIAVLLSIVILAYLVMNFIYPAMKRVQKFRQATKIAGGPKGHWFWGDMKEVGNS